MEAAGLAIGVLALAGTFKDCIDLISLVSAARNLGRDAEILDTKLDVEKMIFLQWADRVKLLEQRRHDPRLDDPGIRRTVERVLTSMKTFLSEGKALEHKYGLRTEPSDEGLQLTDTDNASSSRMTRFLKDFERLKTLHKFEEHVISKAHSSAKAIRWVAFDKDKFNGLIQELSYFNSRLNTLVPASPTIILEMSREDLNQLHFDSISKLDMIADMTETSQPLITDVAKETIRQLRVLKCLWFRWMDDRETNVKAAHSKTLEWALDPPKGVRVWDDLPEWFRDGSGMYWLAGKAGCGKSTLMKYLHGHSKTEKLLGDWAQDSKLITASFFFYALGHPEQKSLEGLLRGLLYQILEADPTLIPTTLPLMWQEVLVTENSHDEISVPSIAEMQKALRNIIDACSRERRLVLFVDGLDEYDGDLMEFAVYLKELSETNSYNKILVSSRPLPAFVTSFSQKPKMYLQDLTRGDIMTYINDLIGSHEYIKILSMSDPEGPKQIMQDLIRKSSGVFLWVYLACRSLLQGFAAYDTITDLRQRVDELPPELEDLFDHMLARIEPRGRERALKYIRLVFDNQTRSEAGFIPTIALALSDEQDLRADSTKLTLHAPTNEAVVKCQTTEGRIRSRCCGLLEIQKDPEEKDSTFSYRCSGSLSEPRNAILHSQVVFIHRSVYEFLSKPGAWQREVMRIHGTFDAHATLSSIWVQAAQLAHDDVGDSCITQALAEIRAASAAGGDPFICAITFSKLQFVLGACERIDHPTVTAACLAHSRACRFYWRDFSLVAALAAELGMVGLLKLIRERPHSLKSALVQPVGNLLTFMNCDYSDSGCGELFRLNQGRSSGVVASQTALPLLYHATAQPLLSLQRRRDRTSQQWLPGPSQEVLRYLLEAGNDVNEPFLKTSFDRSETPGLFVEWLASTDIEEVDANQLLPIVQACKLLLSAGARIPPPESSHFEKLRRVIASLTHQAWRVSARDYTSFVEEVEDVTSLFKNALQKQWGTSAMADFEDFLAPIKSDRGDGGDSGGPVTSQQDPIGSRHIAPVRSMGQHLRPTESDLPRLIGFLWGLFAFIRVFITKVRG